MKNTLFALLLLSATFALGQGSVLSGGPIVANPLGQPLPGVTVAVCNSDPGTPTTGGCPGHLATLYTDVTVATACTGTTPIKPLSNPGGAGSGCSNPGTVDGRGNAVAFSHAGQYWCEYYGTGLTGVAVQPCMFPGTAAGVEPITITCTGTNRVSAYDSITGAFTCAATATPPASPNFSVQANNGGVFGGIALGNSGDVLTSNGAGSIASFQPASAGGAPGAPDTSVQFNCAGAFCGTANMLWDNTNQALSVNGGVSVSTGTVIAGNTVAMNIGNVGVSGATDYAIQTGWGKSQFGEDTNLLVWPDDPTFNGLVNSPRNTAVVFGDASTNLCTVSHFFFHESATFPTLEICSAAGNTTPIVTIQGNGGDAGDVTTILADKETRVSPLGQASTEVVSNATGNSVAHQITASSAAVGGSASALEVTGLGDGYEKSFGLQVQSTSRAIFTGGAQLKNTTSQPTCDAEIRGTFWNLQGAAGVADIIQVCMKDAANAYAWHTVTIP